MPEGEIYCPICNRTIIAENVNMVKLGYDLGYVFVHDEIIHPNEIMDSDSDIEAMQDGIQ